MPPCADLSVSCAAAKVSLTGTNLRLSSLEEIISPKALVIPVRYDCPATNQSVLWVVTCQSSAPLYTCPQHHYTPVFSTVTSLSSAPWHVCPQHNYTPVFSTVARPSSAPLHPCLQHHYIPVLSTITPLSSSPWQTCTPCCDHCDCVSICQTPVYKFQTQTHNNC